MVAALFRGPRQTSRWPFWRADSSSVAAITDDPLEEGPVGSPPAVGIPGRSAPCPSAVGIDAAAVERAGAAELVTGLRAARIDFQCGSLRRDPTQETDCCRDDGIADDRDF